MLIKPKLNEKQKEAFKRLIDENTFEVLYGGAAGGGKSYLGCLWLIIQCMQYPGTRWLVGRKELKSLKQTTLNTFFEVCARFNINKDIHYSYNEHKGVIKFHNESEIVLRDLAYYPSDPEYHSLGSLEITGAFIDEAAQISKKCRDIVKTRIRYKLDEYKLSPKLLMTCNPSKGWIYNEFYRPWSEQELESNKAFIPATIADNKYLPKGYKKNFEGLDTLDQSRLLYGQWNYADQASLFNYDNLLDSFILNKSIKVGDYYISVDVARLGEDKTIIMVAKVNDQYQDGDLAISLVDVVTLSKARQPDVYREIEALKNAYNIPSNYYLIIDSDGVGGGLADTFTGCQEIMNGSTAMMKENYQNLKTQLYYKLSELVNNEQVNMSTMTAQVKEMLIEELQVVKREDVDQDSKLKITSKKNIKNMLGRSPDYSDALAYLCYAFYLSGGDYEVYTVDL